MFFKVKYSERNMTYGTCHLLIGGGGIFRGRVKKKILVCEGGGGAGSLHEK